MGFMFCDLHVSLIEFVLFTVLSALCSLVITCWYKSEFYALMCVMLLFVLSLSQLASKVMCGT